MLASWVASVTGRALDVDGAYGPQCVDLVNDWARRGLGVPTFVGDVAARLIPARPGYWSWVPNGPVNYPLAGDVVIWHPNLQAAIGPAGHTAVVLVADPRQLVTLDQNWAGHPEARMAVHGYPGVAGWWAQPR